MMQKTMIATATMAAFGAALFASAPAQAENTRIAEAIAKMQDSNPLTTYAQYRYRHGYYGRPAYRGRYYGRPYHGRYYHRDHGSAAAAGIAGLAAGALIGGAIASQQAQAAPTYVVPNQSAHAYCSQRFRSYDPASGTYLGYDGNRHPCP
ncbi:BA14K family protein [Microvirga massiliensis]|uniref:BA14K family protein n=1 Tax=Microvirga massiliensis TaxID=1033741 RepID=UPI00062B92B1